ncbi:class I SAM-dependent methyltransferase [Domibacillus aminovorans]|uniref:SAM-dependent methyltransferase n=1 Tax=Domibacillus aminovorans TaxID=29332 RepID=A0A177L7Q0_9BACI|nr:methyltransferase [Domibacillus aminovorans]OAH61235.1 SAM-dependent methyltransferase [Domibacillus aminovorans]
MDEKDYDRLLRIKTAGTLEGLSRSVHYNRYEATPYEALDELFAEYDLKKTDQVVDYGCGKGRLPFYVHHRFHVTVTGIEMNGHLYQEALENQASYMQKMKKAGGSVHFERGLAEEYEVEQADNRFYFFNPFSIQIFMKVVDNILRSVEQQNRSVDLILYYPTTEYVHFLETSTAFALFKEVMVSDLYEQNENERFLIFRL